MRPDQYWATDAEQFTEALRMRNAIAEAREEAQAERRLQGVDAPTGT